MEALPIVATMKSWWKSFLEVYKCFSNFRNESVRKAPRVVCHVFESEEASFIAQSIGQAFQVAYVEFLRANGIDDPAYLREIDYQVETIFI